MVGIRGVLPERLLLYAVISCGAGLPRGHQGPVRALCFEAVPVSQDWETLLSCGKDFCSSVKEGAPPWVC